MDIQWIETLYTALTIFVATIVHGIAGFGFAQVSMGIMPLFRSAASAAVIFSMVAVVSNFRVWWSVRKSFNWKEWLKPIIGLIAGLPLGLYVFDQMDKQQLRLAIGIVLLAGVVLIVLSKQTDILKKWIKDNEYEPGWVLPLVVGFIAGILGGAVAIPGPPMILYGTFMAASGKWSHKQMKAIFTAFFGTLMLYRVAAVVIQGDMTKGLALEAAISIPLLLLGAWIGITLFNRIPQKVFNWIILALLTINAFILIFNA
jgi:uncharacterized membrane protein YfcA